MTDSQLTAIVLIAVAVIGLIGTAITVIVNYKIARLGTKLNQVHKEMNGMKDALVKNAGDLGRAKGIKEGKAEQKKEDSK